MNRISWMSLLSVVALLTVQASFASERVGNFALLDHEGSYHQLRKYGDSKAVVIISIASACVENIDKLPKYRLLRTTWEQQGITFLGLNSSVEDGSKMAYGESPSGDEDIQHHWLMPENKRQSDDIEEKTAEPSQEKPKQKKPRRSLRKRSSKAPTELDSSESLTLEGGLP